MEEDRGLRIAKSLLNAAVVAIIAATLMAIAAVLFFGSANRAVHYLRGEAVLIEPNSLDLGIVPKSQKRSGSFQITNLTGKIVKIVGCRVTCDCVVVREDLPATLSPRETVSIKVAARVDDPSEPFEQEVVFYTDCPDQPYLNATVRARATSDETSPVEETGR